MSADPGAQAMASAVHAEKVHQHLPEEVELANESISVLTELVDSARHVSQVDQEANSLAAWLCLRRALEQVRIAHFCALFGHYSEVPLIARGAYESAGLGRMLALEAEAAEKWMHNPSWQRDSDVRTWIAGRGGDAEGYADYYRQASNYAHPRFVSMTPFFAELDGSVPMCAHPFDGEIARTCLLGTASASLFVIHCFRNASATEDVIPPDLRERMAGLHEAMGGDLGDLDTDWAAIEQRREEMASRARDASGLEGRLESDPLSIHNLTSRREQG